MRSIRDLNIKIFADGANIDSIRSLRSNPQVKGFTTNPTLMRQAGVKDYLSFAREAVSAIDGLPISLEVFSDDQTEMVRQAKTLASLGENVAVKIPITNSFGSTSAGVVSELSASGVRVNVTAVFTKRQVEAVLPGLADGPGGYVSIFAGRIADAGQDPTPLVGEIAQLVGSVSGLEVIWASPREVLNIVQANDCGCHVITVTPELLKKADSLGKDLDAFSLETVRMFSDDASAAGFLL